MLKHEAKTLGNWKEKRHRENIKASRFGKNRGRLIQEITVLKEKEAARVRERGEGT
jgi:hypothetical protein